MQRFGLIVLCMLALCQASNSRAVVLTYTASARPGVNPDANAGASNAWIVTGSGTFGDFLGNSGANAGGNSGAGAGTSAWAIYSDGSSSVTATSTFSAVTSSLISSISVAGDYVSLDFDNGWQDNGRTGGIEFLTAANAVAARLEITQGIANYRVDDVATNFDTGIGFTGDGFNVRLTLNNSSGGYTLQLGSSSFTGRTLAGGAMQIAGVRVFNSMPGGSGFGPNHDVFFNNLQISAAVPEISPAVAIPCACVGAVALGGIWRRVRG
jgi:hypothetical protein